MSFSWRIIDIVLMKSSTLSFFMFFNEIVGLRMALTHLVKLFTLSCPFCSSPTVGKEDLSYHNCFVCAIFTFFCLIV